MSKKLLLNNKDVGYIYHEIFSSDKSTGTITYDDTEFAPVKKYAYLIEAKGASSFPGATITLPSRNFHKVAEMDSATGKYKYTVVSTSADGSKSKSVNFYLDHLLDTVDRSASSKPAMHIDRFYWDDTLNEYLLDINTKHEVHDRCDQDLWDIDSGNANIIDRVLDTTISVIPADDQNGLPLIETNYYKIRWPDRMLVNGSYGQRTLSWYSTYAVTYAHMLGKSPSQANQGELDSLFYDIPMHIIYAVETQTVRTGIKSKIKVPIFGNGTTFALQHTDDYYEGSTVKRQQITYGSITLDLSLRDTVKMVGAEGEGVTVTPAEGYMVDPESKVYFEGFDGKFTSEYSCTNSKSDEYKAIGPYYKAITLGERIDDDNFLFKIVARSADGSKSETVEFILPDMVCTYNDTINDNNAVYPNCYVQWSDEHGCYVYYANSEYILLDNLDTFKYGSFRKAKVQEHLQWVERPAWRSPVMSHLEIMPLADPSTTSNYPNGYYVNADRTEPYYVGAYVQNPIITWSNYSTSSTSSSATEEDRKYTFTMTVKNTQENATEWYSTRDKVNAHLKKYPIELILPRTNPTQLTPILTNITKKIELPYFGPGTTYSLEKDNEWYGRTEEFGSGHIEKQVANIRVSVPTIREHRVAYHIFEGYNPEVKSVEGRVVRSDLPGYLMEAKGNGYIDWDTSSGSYDTYHEVVKLLGQRTPEGKYLYNLYQTSNGGKVNATPFILPSLLSWWRGVDPQNRPTQESYYSNPMFYDILYWDEGDKCYKIEKRTEYYYADTAYGDIEFTPYYYRGYDAYAGGYSWEFPIAKGTNQNIQYSNVPRWESNYSASAFGYPDYEKGSVVPVLTSSNIITDSNDAACFTQQSCTSLDALDAKLKERPMHVVAGAYYYSYSQGTPFPIINTYVRKQIPIKISQIDAIKGTTYTVSNGDIRSKIKLAIPVTYTDVAVPDPTYNLGAPKEFSGSTYVNTGVKLFDSAKDFTILLDYQHKKSDGTYLVDNGVILHCRYESTSTSYRRCGLAVESGTAPAAFVNGGTNYNSAGWILGTTDGTLSIYEASAYRYRIMIVYKAGLPNRIVQVNESGDILFDYPLQSQIPALVTHTRPLYLGCQNSTSNSRSKYFEGTINECKVWVGTALTDGQILKVIGDGPYPKTNYEIVDQAINSSNRINTGVKLFDSAKDFTIAVKFSHTTTATGSTGEVLSLGYSADDTFRFDLRYTKSDDSYKILGGYNNLAGLTNVLANDLKLPYGADGNHCLFIVYKQGVVDKIIDYSTGVYVSLKLADKLPIYAASTTTSLTLGYRQKESGDSTKTASVWDGTMHDCMIWNGKALNHHEMDYIYKYILSR